MKAECHDCGRIVRGCKIITKITHTDWLENPEVAEKVTRERLGQPVYRMCLNFSKEMERKYGPSEGFYEAE